jgi:hypothetical protein
VEKEKKCIKKEKKERGGKVNLPHIHLSPGPVPVCLVPYRKRGNTG